MTLSDTLYFLNYRPFIYPNLYSRLLYFHLIHFILLNIPMNYRRLISRTSERFARLCAYTVTRYRIVKRGFGLPCIWFSMTCRRRGGYNVFPSMLIPWTLTVSQIVTWDVYDILDFFIGRAARGEIQHVGTPYGPLKRSVPKGPCVIRAKHGKQSDHFDSGWNCGVPGPTLRSGR